MKERIASRVNSVNSVVMLAGLVAVGLTGSIAVSPFTSDTMAQRSAAGKIEFNAQTRGAKEAVAAISPSLADGVPVALAPTLAAPFNFKVDGYYSQLSKKMNWVPVRYGGNVLKTPDGESRILLAQSAAQRAGLHEVGLNHRDVYGIINAETTWIPRLGASKNGTPNLGIAQFEPATAKAMGLKDPSDPVQSVHAAAMLLKDAAKWSAKRIDGLKLSPEQRARKLREGVSIFYNLSVKGRNKWNGLNTAKLPIETQRHIANARLGAREAAELEAQLRSLKGGVTGPATVTASLR